MPARVKITVTEGARAREEYVFTGPTVCTVGRAEGCYLRPPNDLMHMNISRRHCVFDIDPPTVRVRDLGSRNGTHVNGKKIGQRDPDQPPASGLSSCATGHGAAALPAFTLDDGDEVLVGSLVFRVEILAPAGEAPGCEPARESQAVLVG
jgi:pSer/pThr/pTyr-binding forkhead associated (FHA) protein